MENPFDEMQRALDVAKATQKAADRNAARMAAMLRGRLRHCDSWVLKTLKKELEGFNAHTGKWKG